MAAIFIRFETEKSSAKIHIGRLSDNADMSPTPEYKCRQEVDTAAKARQFVLSGCCPVAPDEIMLSVSVLPRGHMEMFCCAFLWQSRQPTAAPSKAVEELKQGSTRHRVEAGTDGRFTISAVEESEGALREFQSVARSAIRMGAAGDLKIHIAHRARGAGGLYDYLVLSP